MKGVIVVENPTFREFMDFHLPEWANGQTDATTIYVKVTSRRWIFPVSRMVPVCKTHRQYDPETGRVIEREVTILDASLFFRHVLPLFIRYEVLTGETFTIIKKIKRGFGSKG